MKKNGFTMIELLLTIALLAVVTVIVAPQVFDLMERNKTNSCQSTLNSVIKAAETYVSENKYDLGFTCDGTPQTVTLKTLYDYDYLEGKIIGDENTGYFDNPVEGKEDFYLTDVVTITYHCDTLKFSYSYKSDNVCE